MGVEDLYTARIAFPSVGNVEVSIILQNFFQFLNSIKYVILLRLIIFIVFENYPHNRQASNLSGIKPVSKSFTIINNKKQRHANSKCVKNTNTKNINWIFAAKNFDNGLLQNSHSFLSSSIDEIYLYTNTWINRLKRYDFFVTVPLINIPIVNAQEAKINEIQSKEASIVYNTFSVKDITLSIQSQCLERNKIFLSEQEEQIQFKMILSNPPSANINITFVNDKPDLFIIKPESIMYKSAYYTVTTKNNTVLNVMENNYNLTQYFTVKTFKDSGSSKLKINVDTELNKVYEYGKDKIVEINNNNNNNNSSLGRLIIDKSISEPLEMKATTSNVGTLNTFLILWIVLFMFSLGLSFSGNTLKGLYKWKRLKPFICGYVCQLIINPLVAFILTKIFKLSDYISLGVIIVAASPGSFIAPVFTYYLGGDRALAVGLCLIATIFGSFTFPFTIWLFCIALQIEIETYIPFWETFSLTATQIIPLGIGCLILHFKPNWASKLTKFCPIWAIAIILTSLITSVKNYGQIFINSWQAYSMPIILGIISYVIGFVIPRVFGMNNQQVRAICFNTGLQNSPLALTVIQVLGMPSCGQLMSLVPLHHSLWTLVEGVIIAIAMFFMFPTDVKEIEENSEYPLNLNKNSEENKSMLRDDLSENYSNNTSMMEVNVLDISDVNLHQRLITDSELLNSQRKPNTSISNLTNYNHSGSPMDGSPTISNRNKSHSSIINMNGSPVINLFRNGSMNSQGTRSTILSTPHSPRETSSINLRRNSNFSNITVLSQNNKLSPILMTTPVHQRKTSTTSTVKFNNGNSSPINPKMPTSPTNSSNVDSDVGLEIFDIPLNGSDDDIDFSRRQSENFKPKDPKGPIPSIVIQSMNSSKTTSPILAYSPYQNQNSSPNRTNSHTPVSTTSFIMPTTNLDKNNINSWQNSISSDASTPQKADNYSKRSSQEGNNDFLNVPPPKTDINEIELDHQANQEMKKEDSTDDVNEPGMTKTNSGIKDIINSKRYQKHPRASLSHHPPIIFSQVMNKYLPLVFKKSTPDTSHSPSSPSSSSPNIINPNPSNQESPLPNSSDQPLTISNSTLSNSSHQPLTVSNSTMPNSSYQPSTISNSTLPNSSHQPLTISNSTLPNSSHQPLTISNSTMSNNADQNLLASLNADKMYLNISNNSLPTNNSSNNDPGKSSSSSIQSHQDQKINSPHLLKEKDLNIDLMMDKQNFVDIDTQPLKFFNSINSPCFSINTNSSNLTSLTNRSSIKSLKKHKNKICRTDTIQTFETANSNNFNSIVFDDDSVKSIKEEDLEEDSDGEDIDVDDDDDDDDDIFKDCSLSFSPKGLEDFNNFN
ncbi:hypothetical protein PIROE2DRAFT_10203 [Piromyces sp. E2]|nr:hypothetical protein PIROE2DRAFT_10203 [Piromyces sp. E2]|eukprot:OUM63302.1 hypothetical protein PIROE2DRAFT_10203 [Piromyces sp. E2]